LTDDQGTVFTFDRLLLATGITPRRFHWGGDRVIYFRTLDDYHRLRALTEHGQRFAVIVGGFVGSEIAAALATNQKDVVMLFPDAGIGERLFGTDLALFLNDDYRRRGVDVLAGETVLGMEERGDQVALQTAGGRELLVDGVVAGIGTEPNTALAQAAGLAVDDGVLVDAALRTSDPDIYAAGDVAKAENPLLGRHLRVEHWQNALDGGPAAARSMLGQDVVYDRVPYFFTDQYDLGMEYTGHAEPGSYDRVVFRGDVASGEYIAFWLADGRVLAGMNVNVWDVAEDIARIVRSGARVDPARLADPGVPLTDL
jgi:3-phenylpropionate/trans-cinnamate dioxygenase ferredoxin reductase subunit